MLKNIWQKIRQNHLLLMAICCLVPVILVAGFLSLSKENSNYWAWLIILLCPLMHILMMREHKHNNSCEDEANKKAAFECPVCGLKYKEKKWAEKCEAWCKEHKSCNLEITKHSIKD